MASNFPHNTIINTHVVVNNSISKAPDFVPIYSRVNLFKFIRQSICSFANDFKISDNGINCSAIIGNIFKRHALGVTKYFLATF